MDPVNHNEGNQPGRENLDKTDNAESSLFLTATFLVLGTRETVACLYNEVDSYR